jgi:hypothetical protein
VSECEKESQWYGELCTNLTELAKKLTSCGREMEVVDARPTTQRQRKIYPFSAYSRYSLSEKREEGRNYPIFSPLLASSV